MYSRIYGYTMSIPLLIPWIFAKMILEVDSAPKIGDDLYDPLIFDSSDSYISGEVIIPNFRRDMSPEETRLKYEGYVFDVNKCKHVNSRILCGYDKNRGTLRDDNIFVDMGDGCRVRGDRIECGYENRPYNKHLRRPSENGEQVEPNESAAQHNAMARQAPTRTSMSETITPYSLKMNSEFLQNKLLKSALATILMKPVNKNTLPSFASRSRVKSVKISELTEPITSSTVIISTILDKTEFTVTNDIPILSTTITESTVPELTQTTEKNKIESTATSSKTEVTSTATSSKTEVTSTATSSKTEVTSTTTESTEDISSDWDAMKRIIQLKKNDDHKEAPIKRRRSLAKILSTSNTETDSPINNCETTSSNMDIQIKRNRDDKINTACVEKDDRVVCYDFKT